MSAAEELILQARRLTKQYGHGNAAVRALREVDLEICKSELVAVMGPWKFTTTMGMLERNANVLRRWWDSPIRSHGGVWGRSAERICAGD